MLEAIHYNANDPAVWAAYYDYLEEHGIHKTQPILINSIGMKLVLAPTTSSQCSFYIGIYTITQAQYLKVTQTNPSQFRKQPDLPVERVSWHDAVEFCKLLSALPVEKEHGRDYRLPTEAEWEYACRAGTTTTYSFGDDPKELDAYGWYSGNSRNKTHQVGTKKPNPWGLYDMHGNVWEWCADQWDGCGRVIRGGSWSFRASGATASFRYAFEPSYRACYLGFRVALTPLKL